MVIEAPIEALARAPSPEDDVDLVRRIAQGDRCAFAALYDRYASALLAVARRMLRTAAEAEDLMHDVCLEVWRKAHTYEPERGSVRAWLLVRVRSRALDRIKSDRHVRRAAAEPEEVAGAVGHEADPTLCADYVRVRRALGGLPPEHRAVLDLAYFEGLTLQEIGERLTIPIGTAKSRLSRAIGKLREDLGVEASRGSG